MNQRAAWKIDSYLLEILQADCASECTSGMSLNMPIQHRFKFELFIVYISSKLVSSFLHNF